MSATGDRHKSAQVYKGLSPMAPARGALLRALTPMRAEAKSRPTGVSAGSACRSTVEFDLTLKPGDRDTESRNKDGDDQQDPQDVTPPHVSWLRSGGLRLCRTTRLRHGAPVLRALIGEEPERPEHVERAQDP